MFLLAFWDWCRSLAPFTKGSPHVFEKVADRIGVRCRRGENERQRYGEGRKFA
jgi:hypothetical protein